MPKFIINTGFHQGGGRRVYPGPRYEMDLDKPLGRPGRPDEMKIDADATITFWKHAASRMSGWVYSLQQVNTGDICLEIGVDKGDGIARLVEATPAGHIYGVDPWLSCEGDDWYGCSQQEMDQRHKEVCDRFSGNDKVELFRKTSAEFFVIAQSAGIVFDWIYIDGDHTVNGVFMDLCGSVSVSKPGTLIFGDDISDNKWGDQVRDGLDAFLKSFGHRVEVIWRESNPFCLRVVK